MKNQVIPDAAVEAAENAYRETLTELRLAEGGGFKVASQVKRSLHAALEAAAPHMQNNPYADDAERYNQRGDYDEVTK